MTARVRDYGLAFLSVAMTAAIRYALIPALGNRFGFDFFLISTFLVGRYLGFGPSLFALLAGAIPVTVLHLVSSQPGLHDPYFTIGLLAYLTLGAIVVVLCKSEHDARWALQKEIAERKNAEDIVGTSQGRLQAILNNTSAVIYLKDSQGRYLLINRRYEEVFHISQQEIAGKTDAELFPSEVVAELRSNDRRVQQTGRPLEFEEVVPHRDGPHTYVSVKFPIFDVAGECYAVGGISTDISDRKRAANALEAEQELLRHTIEIQDQERQLIAYEIHDGLVQYAAGALMQLESMQAASEPVPHEIENAVVILRRAVAEGRRLINGIHTPVLDDWGIVAAIEHLVDEEDRAHVQIEFINDSSLGRMEPKIEEALYRITQEALTNVGKHSQTEKVRIELRRRGDGVHLEVRDWGIGFTPSDGSKSVHGLKGMANRAIIAGGRCAIESAPGAGTKIVVDVPYLSRK